ncbi:hypothetical protein BABINDRAFT_160361 [Babjeviella inositovora NRRL Y-12698]|uniref:K Homology domain-containing protein n=1 Tax=Babjeviella inositovora NRRL Y-12698 TaxID=984486 RepID=A0A1E3QT88_9ASCO|nr:uncharacterized protein BABINDRAFT_160361 [Babjeviella inositovora NRRL Y-12698]ODQ80923.1 hypothetical protein BABINDRAFT_160361 [Babjeviella inositovora NRRL Y-12698]
MSSAAAAMLAARAAAEHAPSSATTLDDLELHYSDDELHYDETAPTSAASTPVGIRDESAFPSLGNGNAAAPSPAKWGPGMKVSAAPVQSVSAKKTTSSGTIQSKFEIPLSQLQPYQPPQHTDVLKVIQQQCQVSIEVSTINKLQLKSYLIKGLAANVEKAKKQMGAKLIKPSKVVFSVPAKCKGVIIGPKGKTLKAVEADYGVRIDILDDNESSPEAEPVSEDPFAVTSGIEISGSPSACKDAQAKILRIVDEHLSNVTVKFDVAEADQFLLPFLEQQQKTETTKGVEATFGKTAVFLSGAHRLINDLKVQISEKLAALRSDIHTTTIKLPQALQGFADSEALWKDYQVVIDESKATATTLTLVGLQSNLVKCEREALSQLPLLYKGVVLDISKAHGGDLQHNNLVFQYLKEQGFFKQLVASTGIKLHYDDVIENPTAIKITFIYKSDDADAAQAVSQVRSTIIAKVNELTGDKVKLVESIHPFVLTGAANKKITEHLVAIEDVQHYIHQQLLYVVYAPVNEEEFAPTGAEISSKLAAAISALAPLVEQSQLVESVTVEVAPATQDNALTPQVQRMLLSLVEPASTELQLHVPKPGKVTLVGYKKSTSVVSAQLEKIAGEYKESGLEYTHKLNFPSNLLGRLVGSKGSFLKDLETDFGCRIQTGDSGSDSAEITLVGLKFATQQLATKIQQLTKKWADESVSTIQANSKFHGQMIGGHGANLHKLEEKYGVKIKFPSANSASSEITIKGPSKGVNKATEELSELLLFIKTHSFEKSLTVKQAYVSRIIGKGGEKLRDIMADTGVEIDVQRDAGKSGEVELQITGSQQGIKQAEQQINEIVGTLENYKTVELAIAPEFYKLIIGQQGSTMRAIMEAAPGYYDLSAPDARRLLTIPKGEAAGPVVVQGPSQTVDYVVVEVNKLVDERKNAVTEEYPLLKSKHRLLIGFQGFTRRDLEKEFSCQVNIPRVGDKKDSITLSGQQENLDKLKVKIAELTKDDWQFELEVPQHIHALISDKGKLFSTLRSDFGAEVSHGEKSKSAKKQALLPPAPADLELNQFQVVERAAEDTESVLIPYRIKSKSAANSEKAAKYVEAQIALLQQADHDAWFKTRPSVMNRIVGARGETVNGIREKSLCFIVVPKATDADADVVYLRGTVEGLKVAEKELKAVVA